MRVSLSVSLFAFSFLSVHISYGFQGAQISSCRSARFVHKPFLVWKQELKLHEHQEYAGDTNVSEGPPDTFDLASLAVPFAVLTAFVGLPEAAVAASSDPLPSAAMAWLHFVGVMGVAGSLVTERFLIQKSMSEEVEGKMAAADALYGLTALVLLVSGVFRATGYAKGWDFYQHEPIFWLKMAAFGVVGGLSLFPTILLLRRGVARKQQGQTLAPLSDAMVDRMTTIINAELLAILTIPFLASLMARGVLYSPDFPWPVGAAFVAVTWIAAPIKYVKECLEMTESEGALVPLSDKNE